MLLFRGWSEENHKIKQGLSFSLTEITLNTRTHSHTHTHTQTQEWTRPQTNYKCTLQFHGTFLLSQPHCYARWLHLCIILKLTAVRSCVGFVLCCYKKVFVSLLRELYQIHPVIEKAVCIDEPPHVGRLTFKWLCYNDGSTGGHAIKKTAQCVLAYVNEYVCRFIKVSQWNVWEDDGKTRC